MGSELQVTIWTGDQTTAEKAFAASFAEADRLDAVLSVWKAGSDVLRINAAAGQARWLSVATPSTRWLRHDR